MATLSVHSDSSAQVFARAGEAMLRRTANVLLRVMDYEFAGFKRENTGLPGFEDLQAQSSVIYVDVLRQDVDGAPVDLYDQALIEVDAVPYRVGKRLDREALGQVTFQLEPSA